MGVGVGDWCLVLVVKVQVHIRREYLRQVRVFKCVRVYVCVCVYVCLCVCVFVFMWCVSVRQITIA